MISQTLNFHYISFDHNAKFCLQNLIEKSEQLFKIKKKKISLKTKSFLIKNKNYIGNIEQGNRI